MFFRKQKKVKHKKPFDMETWKEFVRFLAVQKFALNGDKNHEFSPRKIFINYKYMDQKYNCLIYSIGKENGVPVCVSFWLPETEDNKWMDCRLINRCGTTEEAIRYITNLCFGK